jgi:hypothetical protein
MVGAYAVFDVESGGFICNTLADDEATAMRRGGVGHGRAVSVVRIVRHGADAFRLANGRPLPSRADSVLPHLAKCSCPSADALQGDCARWRRYLDGAAW